MHEVDCRLLACSFVMTVRSNDFITTSFRAYLMRYVKAFPLSLTMRLEQLAVTMYKIHNNLSPSYLRRIFTNTSNVHSHNLRNSELNYYVPRPRTESAKGSQHYRGSVLWNRIPSEIRKLPSLNVFKTSFHGKDFSNTP